MNISKISAKIKAREWLWRRRSSQAAIPGSKCAERPKDQPKALNQVEALKGEK